LAHAGGTLVHAGGTLAHAGGIAFNDQLPVLASKQAHPLDD
jgi:hypothetical protein